MSTSDRKRSITEIPVPEDAPGPDDSVIAEKYKGRMVIYARDDAGWESRIEIEMESQWAFTNVRDAR